MKDLDDWNVPWVWIITACVAIGVAVFLLNAGGYISYKTWAPKFEEARRETFENSPSFIRGKQQYLVRLYGEWSRADAEHKGALCTVARQEMIQLKPEYLPPALSEWECVK